MHLLIVEDEPPIAETIAKRSREILGDRLTRMEVTHCLSSALEYTQKHDVDLCLLDLNLNGLNGFDVLKESVSHAFHTIVISAYTDRALEAFEYGILDFVPKPFTRERFEKALSRYFERASDQASRLRYLVVRKLNANHPIAIEKIRYFRAQRYLVEVHLIDGQIELIEKSLGRLEQVLPDDFLRIHRSYIIRVSDILSIKHIAGGQYEAQTKEGTVFPVSRQRYKILSNLINPH